MFSEPCVSFIFPSIGSVCGSPFPPRGPLERRSPAFSVLRRAPTSDRPSRLASFPSLGGTSSVSGDGRISQVPGEPQCERAPVCDPGGTSAPGIAALRCGLPCGKRRRLPRRVPFRGSITRPTHSLCTLRSRGHPRTTQHSVPAGCQPLPGRSATCWVPSRGFSYISSSSPRLCLAHFPGERRPALPVASGSRAAHVPLNRSLADVDAQLEQLTTDALGSPAWVAPRHLADERDPLRRWSTGSPRATSPERAESCAMPAENGRGLDEQGCFTPSWRNSRGENNLEALPGRPADAAGNLPLRGDELLSKKRILRNQFNATANEIRSQPGNEPKKIDHGSSLTPSTCGWNL